MLFVIMKKQKSLSCSAGKAFIMLLKMFFMPIKRFVYAAEEVAHAEKDALSCCETGFVMSRKSLFHNAEEPLSPHETGSFILRKSLFHDTKKAL